MQVSELQKNLFIAFGLVLLVTDLYFNADRGYQFGNEVGLIVFVLINVIVIFVGSIFISPQVAKALLGVVGLIGLFVCILSAGTVISSNQNSREVMDSQRKGYQSQIDSLMATRNTLQSAFNDSSNKSTYLNTNTKNSIASYDRQIASLRNRISSDINRRGSHASTGFTTWLGAKAGYGETDSNNFLVLLVTLMITLTDLAWWSFIRSFRVVKNPYKKVKKKNAVKSGPPARNVSADVQKCLTAANQRGVKLSTKNVREIIGGGAQAHVITVKNEALKFLKLEGVSNR